MFDLIAPRYDLVNLFISLGQARARRARAHPLAALLHVRTPPLLSCAAPQTTLWRVIALGWLPRAFPAGARVLDVGCGASAERSASSTCARC